MKFVLGILVVIADAILISLSFLVMFSGTIRQPRSIALFLLLFGSYNLYFLFKSKFWVKSFSPKSTSWLTFINLAFLIVFLFILIKIISDSQFSKKFGTNDEDYPILIVAILIPVVNFLYNLKLKSLYKNVK